MTGSVLDAGAFVLSNTTALDGLTGYTLTVRARDLGKPGEDTVRFLLRDESGAVICDSGTAQVIEGDIVIHGR